MNKAFAFLLSLCWISYFSLRAADRAVLVHNTLQDIDNCKGKLKLKLIRIWGGHEEEDENKFFQTPTSITIDHNQSIYICDLYDNCIKVFSNTGKYIRTIGRKGQGPGDTYSPIYITFSPGGDLLVNEFGSRRIQWFNTQGKSKHILKQKKEIIEWISVVSENEIAAYAHLKTFRKRKLVSIMNNKGKVLREIGQYHDTAKNFMLSERLHFSSDKQGNIYAANTKIPVIRKYSPGGRMLTVITFATPFDIPVEIVLNKQGDEIERKEETYNDDKVKVVRTEKGVSIQYDKKNKKKRAYGGCSAISIDSQNRIYIVTRRRYLTEKESMGTRLYGSLAMYIKRDLLDYSVVENIDVNRLMVFDSNGKIIGQCTMTTFCDGLYIYNNRIFVVDGYFNQRVLEYEMVFK